MGAFAWVTLATNDSYSLGALVLAHSLKQAGTTHQLAVLVTPGVTNVMRKNLADVFNVVEEVNLFDSKDETNLRLLKRPELGVTFTKLHCWRLTQFEKCVFLDADVLVLANADELFEREEFSAAPDVGWPDCFNSGVFVYKPSMETYNKLVEFAVQKGSFDGGDQGLLNAFFSDWAHKDISKHLPFIYNMCSTACYSYLPAFKYYGSNVKIVHFIGPAKPWLQYFDTETRTVHPSSDLQHLGDVLQKWWSIFCSLIHPKLTPDMSGLAGAFAQFTLGAKRSESQDALENHLRRQAWEVGNIDYMGRDSFDNIWSKICETLNTTRIDDGAVSSPESQQVPEPPQSTAAEPLKSVEETKSEASNTEAKGEEASTKTEAVPEPSPVAQQQVVPPDVIPQPEPVTETLEKATTQEQISQSPETQQIEASEIVEAAAQKEQSKSVEQPTPITAEPKPEGIIEQPKVEPQPDVAAPKVAAPKEEPKAEPQPEVAAPQEAPKAEAQPVVAVPKEESQPEVAAPQEVPKAEAQPVVAVPQEEPKAESQPEVAAPQEVPKEEAQPAVAVPKEEPKTEPQAVVAAPQEEPKAEPQPEVAAPQEEPKAEPQPQAAEPQPQAAAPQEKPKAEPQPEVAAPKEAPPLKEESKTESKPVVAEEAKSPTSEAAPAGGETEQPESTPKPQEVSLPKEEAKPEQKPITSTESKISEPVVLKEEASKTESVAATKEVVPPVEKSAEPPKEEAKQIQKSVKPKPPKLETAAAKGGTPSESVKLESPKSPGSPKEEVEPEGSSQSPKSDTKPKEVKKIKKKVKKTPKTESGDSPDAKK